MRRRHESLPRDGQRANGQVPPGVTQEDLDRHREIEERRAKGEYVLDLEDPLRRKAHIEAWQELIEETAARRATDGREALLSALGLPPQASAALDQHLSKIQEASLEAEAVIKQFQRAQLEYDKRVRTLLGEDGYARYREFEGSLSAQREVNRIAEFLGQRQVRLSDGDIEVLKGAVQATGAFAYGGSGGPYDPLPNPAVGDALVSQKIRSDILRISRSGEAVVQKLSSEKNLGSEALSVLPDYYLNRVTEKQDSLDDIQRWQERGTLVMLRSIAPSGMLANPRP